MKLFGKKTLALLLALSMVMSVCVFAENGTGSEGGDETLPVYVTGIDASAKTALYVGEETTITAEVAPAEASQEFTCKLASGDAVSVSGKTVTAVKAGTATVTVTTVAKKAPAEGASEGEAATTTLTFNVQEDKIKSAAASNITVPYGYTAAVLTSKLNAIDVSVTYSSERTGTVKTTWEAVDSTVATDIGATKTYRAKLENVIEGFVQPTVTVTVGKATTVAGESTNVGTITVLVGTPESEVKELLPPMIHSIAGDVKPRKPGIRQ